MTGPETTSATAWTTVSRRALLQGGAVAVVAALAGFVAFKVRTTPSGPSAPYGGSGGSTVLVPLADVPQNGGVVVADAQVVVVRDSNDGVKGYTAVCTHQGCLVNRVQDGFISCPCHGSVFEAATGQVARGPATQPLATVAVHVDGANVVAG